MNPPGLVPLLLLQALSLLPDEQGARPPALLQGGAGGGQGGGRGWGAHVHMEAGPGGERVGENQVNTSPSHYCQVHCQLQEGEDRMRNT